MTPPRKQPAHAGTRPSSRPQTQRSGTRSSAPNKTGRTNTNRKTSGRNANRRGARKPHERRPSASPYTTPKKKDDVVPPVEADTVRIIPLGGVEEVGRNMALVETAEDMVVIDVGFQFVAEDAPGVDYILPNTRYIEERKEKLRAVIITHGHLDHIGGIPYIMDRIGNPPIYTSELTAIMIKKRNEEFPHMKGADIKVLDSHVPVTLGSIKLRTFPVTHSIPDSTGVILETKHGNVLLSGDLKLDHVDGKPSKKEEENFGRLGKEKNLILIADSTNAEKDGFSIPEQRVYDTLEEIIRNTKGRLIIGTFASQFERMIKIIEVCEKLGKKVATEGRSIRTNLEIAEKANRLKPKKGTLISAQEMSDCPPDKIVILATGAQGEEFAALSRIATNNHRFIKLNRRDTIVLSSSVIPGNEVSVQRLKDNLYRHAGKVIHYRASDVHSTGHGNTGELVWIREQVKPKFFMPGYGYHSMLRCHATAQIEAGFPEKNIVVPDNGTIVDIKNGETMTVLKEKAPSSPMMVDGFSIGDVQDVVIRDRKSLAQDGMFVVIITLNLKTGKLRKSPDIISRGFVYLRESQDLLQQVRLLIKKNVEDTTKGMYPINIDYVKDNLTDATAAFLFQKTNKHPIVIPVIVGV
ncbi:hypothetical protein COU17_01390 [Candidatus Kaiserbacteria bacterium CG10_big_fil_rev_8_21_14_0_10_49_17]|uniref:Metallo-beta-lactamase domain-containing protein n=1 Tax=Candidatus Kaiserbacteria bacterium CG10_big_fil_rev_8_21_14_0_10_49_17 TaxID=1974609 RepID=A0A2M6WEU2_9BACT|nr:MAG: hypothetical protein COU17_01390 [Candidatus Kaiserbacteria bacterium CG10_big_fil_rev_8_21_14_0_10_49_17]